MGLDQYLYAKKFLSTSSWDKDDKVHQVAQMMGAEELLLDPDSLQFAHLELQIAYWRKSNQIHKFFVDNCANGEDNCQETYVSVETLQELLTICEKVLQDHSLAQELLPTQSGFFFGSTDYDEWYYETLEQTAAKLKKLIPIIESHTDWDVYYRASW